jgi:hypothetical protein
MEMQSSDTQVVPAKQAAAAEAANPPIIPWVRWFTVVVALILAAGATLFFAPDLIGPRWPWKIAPFPFNMRFLGAIYLSELLTVALVVAINRWTPARVIMPMAITFAVVVTLVSFLYHDEFDFNRVAGWAWFVVYIAPPLVWGYYYLRYRHLPPTGATPTSPGWRLYLYIQGAILGLYGLALLALPATFGTIWPWKVDDFHLRVYSSVFLVAMIGAFLIAQRAAAREWLVIGLTQILLGLTAILSVLWVDSSVHKVNWSNALIWLWFAGFAILALAGAAMMMRWRRIGAQG